MRAKARPTGYCILNALSSLWSYPWESTETECRFAGTESEKAVVEARAVLTSFDESAIQKLTQIEASLTDYRIRAVTKGKEAMGEVQIELEHTGRKIRGRGLSTDILEASALAYLAAINRLRSLSNRERLVTQHSGV